MAKKQKSFADKAAGNTSGESVYVKYVKSIQSEKTGKWRFNEQMVRMNKGEQLDAALKRMDEAANLVDIDLSEFNISDETDKKDIEQEALNDKPSTEDQKSNSEIQNSATSVNEVSDEQTLEEE